MADCEHEWEPLEFEDGEKSKASVCLECGALKSGQGSIVITADYIDFSPLTADPTLAEGRQWFRSDLDSIYWSPDGSIVERMETSRPGVSGSLVGIKGFEYLIEGGATDSWKFTMNPSAGVWIKQYSTDAAFQAKMVYHGAYQHWTGDNTFVDVPNKADNVYGAGEEVVAHQTPDGTLIEYHTSGAGNTPYSLTWDGEYLWQTDRVSGHIYKVKTDGTQVSVVGVPTAGTDLRGITWDGEYLWFTDYNNTTIYQMKTDGTQVSKFAAPGPGPHDLTWDGEYLWHASSGSYTIYKLNPDGTQAASLPAPSGGLNKGVAWDGEYLWTTDQLNGTVYQLKTDGTQVSKFTAPASPPTVAWDGQYLWSKETYDINYRYGATGSFDLDYRITPA